MIWIVTAWMTVRWARKLGTSEAEELAGRVDFMAAVIMWSGFLLVFFGLICVGFLAYADASASEAIAASDAAGAAFWSTMRSWLEGAGWLVLVL